MTIRTCMPQGRVQTDYARLVGVDQVRGRRHARCRSVGSSADIHARAEFRTDLLVVRGSVAM
jgi:hypothetical protein